ncbi:zinc finger protein castor homolog 1 isoform X2 [Rhineura floridana]|uniref:zinc finger protein castor homolog 1 isoform X2 n=1 Tax=Rhineura floridana TaxID=261503 RepID=UPI002AC85C74|nr:zinc finger protein castor homolog 1 isoform X2 [Rhineura floridana]XP_061458109.1 zinc finger protein castor homolog 1 isoform X2 [Rhineura floridana]XP_061458110.1 zinc finger protein castor homolog 1 isoform X2 [Rhineura floridana]
MAERTICTDATSGNPKMAAKRKGGLKLNAICAKLSRQVVVDHKGPKRAPADKAPLERESGGGTMAAATAAAAKDIARPGAKELGPEFPEGVHRVQKIEEDKRREVIEKWVNGEYSEDSLLGRIENKEAKSSGSAEVPPEGVYMVQPKGCSDEEDNVNEAEALKGSQEGSFLDERDLDGPPSKDENVRAPSSEVGSKLSGAATSGEASSLRDYAATTMNEFLGMFGYDDQNMRDELARKISFEKLNTATSEAAAVVATTLAGEDAMSKRARFSKYEEYIRKLKAGEQVPWPIHSTKTEELTSKLCKEAPPVVGQAIRLPAPDASLLPETKATILPLPSPSSSQMQGLMSRASKYDFFIQKLKTGETLRPQNGNTYKKTSKYDLENVKYLHLFKPGEGSPDMGGAIAFKTGKVGRPSKYDVRNIQKLTPVKAPAPSLGPPPLASTPSSAPVAGPEQPASLPFNAPEYLKSTFSKTDSITTGTVSTVKNGLTTDKPAVTEDVNIYQKYIARFSGSQHCGHIHCAYQYREHYHCLDPECNYQRFTSKQDVIRHYNMHKKRDNSLQHGFMRFSPLDDCSVYYHGCHLNGKSTHYHCMQVGCNKVYTSTSDVMTHENFHKKNTQLINDGFQRFRATEDCGTVDCQFYGQKTTHFHCRRPGCTFTFKNKCDIEKHKSYHIKDDAYAKDGFKKFYKYEECKYEGCVYSKATNHFHCIRPGCGFTFTSTSQMTSHKRKHERRHIRSSGVLGLPASLLGAKDNEQEESSNDDLIDFSAMSSKNSSLSASPTSQQSSVSLIVPGAPSSAAELSASQASSKPASNMPSASKIPGILSQALPSNIPLALALSNTALPGTAGSYFPILPSRVSTPLPASSASLIATGTSTTNLASSANSPSQAISGSSEAAATSSPTPAASIMERISASKGLISPMMARLAAAALKPSVAVEAGNGQPTTPGRFNPTQTKQEATENPGSVSTVTQDSLQEHSLDLSVKDHGNESNGHTVSANSSLLSSLMNKMSQSNANLGNLLGLKVDSDSSQLGPSGDATQYLGKTVKALVQEKLSEPWKMYLRRFGTKDFCDAQCDFLHKVHFHCVVEECGALFSTLDGAIKHANFHFRTEGGAVKGSSEFSFPTSAETKTSLAPSSPSASSTALANASAPDGPTPSPVTVPSTPTLLAWKQLASTISQIPASVPNLATSPLTTTSLENAKPQVKPGFLQFQEHDPCLATDCKYANKFHFHCLFGNCKYVCKTSGKAESHCLDHINPNNNLVNVRDQFAYYSLQCLCPNQHCEFRMRGHYHCLRPGCFFVTNITTKLPWHVKKHEKAERRAANGFKYFTKREECGRLGCKYNQVNSHFHCIREGCQFSFLLKHQMTSHARKHMRRMLGKNFDRVPTQVIGHAPRNENLPQVSSMAPSPASSGTPASFQGPQSMMDTETDEYIDYTGCSPGGISSESSNMDRSCSSTPVGNESTSAGCLAAAAAPPPPDAAAGDDVTHNAPQPPPLPPSFSQALLRSPLPSLPYLFSPSCVSYSLLSATLGSSRGLVLPTASSTGFSPIIAAPTPVKSDVPLVQDAAGNTITMPTAAGAKKRFWIIEDMSPFGKRRKTASSRKMLDEGMMLEGFRRYDLYEDCKDASCQFSLKVTHYHCTRENCGYKFCGRTHMYKHAQHHDRVDNLVLDDFKRFKSSLSCNFPDCQFSGNSTHFHCLRCGFRCTDSTKVTAHRKHHGKQDVISAAGFCQFSSSVDCEVPDCKYKLKCSHFHCTYPGCKHTVVGMSQMDSHKRKHEKQERGELPAISPGPEGLPHSTLEYDAHNSSVNLDSSLNLGTDANSSLFFLQNAAGVGLNDSLDLSQKPSEAASATTPSPVGEGVAPMESERLPASCDNVEDEDDSSHEEEEDDDEEMNEEDEEEEDDEDDEDDEEEEEEEEDLNTDSEESLPDNQAMSAKDVRELGEAVSPSADHSDASRLPGKQAPAPEAFP